MALHKYLLNFFSSIRHQLTAIVLGSLICLTFPPYNIHILFILSFGFLFFKYPSSSPKKAAQIGLFFGIGMFGSSVSWVYISIHEFGHVHPFFAILITLLFIITLSVFTMLHGFFVSKLSCNNHLINTAIFSSAWIILEWLRGWILTGFPWLYIGYSQVETIYGSYLPIVGVFGTSFISVTVFCLISHLLVNIKQIKYNYLALILTIVITACGYFLEEYNWTTKDPNPISVSLIQSNIDQNIKWNRDNLNSTLQLFYEMTNSSINSDLVIWPESAIPLVKKNAAGYLEMIDRIAKQNDSGVILGILITKKEKIYNGIIGIGVSNGEYLKQYLVPLGEFIPFKPLLEKLIRWLNFPIGDLQHGTTDQKNILFNDIQIAPFICYEVAYAKAFLDFRKNAQVFLTVSNDAWFGESIALNQHLQMAQARARQAGKYHLVSTNTGITAIINDKGRIMHKAAPFQVNVLKGNIYPMDGLTPWSKMGVTPIIILSFIIIIMACINRFKYS